MVAATAFSSFYGGGVELPVKSHAAKS